MERFRRGGEGGGKGDRAGVCHTQLSTAGETERKATNRERERVKAETFEQKLWHAIWRCYSLNDRVILTVEDEIIVSSRKGFIKIFNKDVFHIGGIPSVSPPKGVM